MAGRQLIGQVNVDHYVIQQQDARVANKSSLKKAKYIAILAFITDICLLTILGIMIPVCIWILLSPVSNTRENLDYCTDVDFVANARDAINSCWYPVCFGLNHYNVTVYEGNAYCDGVSTLQYGDIVTDGDTFSYFYFSIAYFPLFLYIGMFAGLTLALTVITICITLPITLTIIILLGIVLLISWIAFLGTENVTNLISEVWTFVKDNCINKWYALIFHYFVRQRYDKPVFNGIIITLQVFASIDNIAFLCYYGFPTLSCNCDYYQPNSYLVDNDAVEFILYNGFIQVLMIIYITLSVFVLISRRIIYSLLVKVKLEKVYSVYKPFSIQINYYG